MPAQRVCCLRRVAVLTSKDVMIEDSAIRNEPGVPVIRNINWSGTYALYRKECRRFMKVQLQTLWAPALTTLLFLVIFSVALGGQRRTVLDAAFADFLAPGLIMMGMLNNAFANSSFALLVAKVQGTLVDYLMPPISVGEMLAALVASSMTRGLGVGIVVWLVMLLWPGVDVTPRIGWAIVYFAIMGTAMLAFMGVLTSIWAEKFDHAAAVTNFVIAPLTLLSGTFYSVERLSPAFATFSHLNPFFYTINGFRYGFVGRSDTDMLIAVVVTAAVTLMLAILAYVVLRRGWKIKS